MNNTPIVILLAEDDSGHAKLVERNLKRGGFVNEVVHVPDGRQALDYVFAEGRYAGRTRNGPLLLVLDINMPQVDGVEVLRRIKSDPATDKLPVIMLTTTDDPREVARCYEFGCSVYVTKPVAYDAFVEAIHRLGLFLQVVTVPREDGTQKA
ncbi:MAG TPA: response regulator [Planctomycetaceae bacterium]|nr:response regulator [Planctomycetaceae bacterium]